MNCLGHRKENCILVSVAKLLRLSSYFCPTLTSTICYDSNGFDTMLFLFCFFLIVLFYKDVCQIFYHLILKRKSFTTAFRPCFLQHGPSEDIFIIIYEVPAQRVVSCRKSVSIVFFILTL